MLDLLWLMIQRMGILFIIAFTLTRTKVFRNLIEHKLDRQTILKLSIIFGLFGILGTYTGVSVKPTEHHMFWVPGIDQIGFEEAIANSRVVGVVIGGLLGGPYVGLTAGLIAGIHRMFLGGFSGIACGVSTIVEGIIAGFIYKNMKEGRIVSVRTAFLTGIITESVQMIIILLIAKPFNMAWLLVQMIAFPMIFTNSIGIAVFVAIIRSVIEKEDRIEANQTEMVLNIADQMLSHLRRGLNEDSAREVLKIIFRAAKVPAVSITDSEKILAHIGLGEDHHIPGQAFSTEAILRVLRTGEMAILTSKEGINCKHPRCPLAVAIFVPLKKGGEVVGVLKFYFTNPNQIRPVDWELAEGLGKLLSHQLEVAEAERQAKLLSAAEIKALQAQVNPHFLFNSLNTIVALIRTNPDMARNLLVKLGFFFRQNLNASLHEFVSLEQEMEHTRAYLDIEQARFSDRLNVDIQIDPSLNKIQLPPLTLQPLVENALRHGLKDMPEGGRLTIKAEKVGDRAKITVQDNGVGFPFNKIDDFLWKKAESQGRINLGLYNVNQRLVGHFGQKARLYIEKAPGGGTIVWFEIPGREGGENDH